MKKFIPLFFSAIITEVGAALVLWGFGSLLTYIVNIYAGTAIPLLPFWAYLVAVFIIVVLADLLHLNQMLTDSLRRMKAMEAIAKEVMEHRNAETLAADEDTTETDDDDDE